MEYRNQQPVTKGRRAARRAKERARLNRREETNRKRSKAGGSPNELGIIQGQNGEQGNTVVPENASDIGRRTGS